MTLSIGVAINKTNKQAIGKMKHQLTKKTKTNKNSKQVG